jgi:hypothetical protein
VRFIVGTRNQVRDALDALTLAYAIPNDVDPRVRTTRYSEPARLVGGEWCAIVKDEHVAALSSELAALVVADLPVVRRADPAYRATIAADVLLPAAEMSTLHELVRTSAWMRPVVVRATLVDLPQDMPTGEGVEHLWDTSEPDPLGTRYLRADGERLFVVQQIANSTDHVFVLWFGGDAADPNETLYSQAMIAAATSLGVVLESVECVYDRGAWLVGEMAEGSTIASRWPSTWRVFQPGDGATPSGARCIREVALVS